MKKFKINLNLKKKNIIKICYIYIKIYLYTQRFKLSKNTRQDSIIYSHAYVTQTRMA